MGNLCHVQGEEPQFGLESRVIQQDQNSLKEIDPNDMPSSDYAVLANNNLIMLPAVQKARSQHKSQFSLFGKNSKYPLMKLVKKKGLYYQGPWKKGLEQGNGAVFGQDGSYLEGTFDQGKLNGKGAQIFNDGSIYQGEYRHGLFNGKGKFTYRINGMTYNGEWKDGKPNGVGEQVHPSVGVYKGHFLNGLKHSLSTTSKEHMEWEDGRKYVGPFKDGYMHGQGELTKSNNHGSYKGNFDRNNKTDSHVMKTQFGSYQGPFVHGQMEGHGVFTWNNGNVYKGDFKNNKLHGNGELTLKGKAPFKGTWENGVSTFVSN